LVISFRAPEINERVTVREIFLKVYKEHSKNRLTPEVYGYYGSVKGKGKPRYSQYICELSKGEYSEGKIPIYGVTVIQYHSCEGKWKPNVGLSILIASKDKADEYARKLGLSGELTSL